MILFVFKLLLTTVLLNTNYLTFNSERERERERDGKKLMKVHGRQWDVNFAIISTD